MKKDNKIVFWVLVAILILQMTVPDLLFWLLIICIISVLLGGIK